MDKVTNKEILDWIGLPSMEDLLIRKNFRWIGHLMGMSPDRLPKQVLYSQLSSDHRKRGHGHHPHSREINGEQTSSELMWPLSPRDRQHDYTRFRYG